MLARSSALVGCVLKLEAEDDDDCTRLVEETPCCFRL